MRRLKLRRAQRHYPHQRGDESYDVWDASHDVGMIYRVNDGSSLRIKEEAETWVWGINIALTRYGCNDRVASFEEAKATFLFQYERWLKYQAHKSIIEKEPLNPRQVVNATVVFAGGAVDWQGKSHGVIRLDIDQDHSKPIGDFHGEFEKKWLPDGNHFNIEVGRFGFFNKDNFGNPDISASRRRFTADEAQAIEQRIRRFASDPTSYRRPELFLGGVTFQVGWILRKEKPSAIARMVRRLLSRSKITDCRVEWQT